MMKTRTISWAEFSELVKSGRRVTGAYLYEQQNCRDGSEFVLVDFGNALGKILKRIWPEVK